MGTSAGTATRQAHRDLRSGLALRASIALGGAVMLVIVGVLLARAGIVRKTLPPYAPGQTNTVISAYSGPLLATAVGVGALAGLLLVAAVTDWWRRRLIGPEIEHSHAGLGQ